MKIPVITASVFLFATLAGGTFLYAGSRLATDETTNAVIQESIADTAKAVFAIENMTCAACPITVRTAMSRVDGVKNVDVDFNKKTATVVFDPGQTNTQLISKASTDVGYPATQTGETL